MSLLAPHAAPDDLGNVAARLRLADRGPYLIYDLKALRRTSYALARIGQEEGIRFIAAAKALPCDHLLGGVCRLHGFDISNEAELRRVGAWRSSIGSGMLSYVAATGPMLARSFGSPEIVAERMTVNLDDESQVASFDRFASWAHTTELGIRIGRAPWNGACNVPFRISRFGRPPSDLEAIGRLARHPQFAGFHCHVGGDRFPPDSHVTALESLLALAASLGITPRVYNLGGSFRRETTGEMRAICRRLRQLAPANVEIVLEPGAWLTAAVGYGLGKLISARYRRDLDATVVVIDLSRDCHLRWSELELLRWWGDPPSTHKILVFGPTCHEGDYLGAFEWPGPLGENPPPPGGWMLFGGVTGYSAAFNCGFNGIDPARVVSFGNL